MYEAIIAYLKGNFFMLFYPIALVLSVTKYRNYYTTVLKYLPIIIGYALLSEVLGMLIRDYDGFRIVSSEEYSYANNLIFNIYDVVVFSYFYFVFWKTLRKTTHKKVIEIGAALYAITSLINPFFQDFFLFPQIYASSIGSLILIMSIVLYFKEIKQNQQKRSELLIWLSIGLFIFNLFFPFVVVIGRFDFELYKELNLRPFHHLLICAMYTCFIIGFLRTKPTNLFNEVN